MKLITISDYQIKVADEALLVKPIRKLFNQDRSKGKEQFYKQMSVLYFVYSPTSNYSYIIDEKERLKEVLLQEGIQDFSMSADFKAAVEVYKKLVKTTSSELLEDVRLNIFKLRQALNSVSYTNFSEEKDKVSAINTISTVLGKMPKLVKDLSEAEKAVNKELEEQGNARGSADLTVGDIWSEQGI
jgi:nucleotidyltransferase/DNA polymerase involved in DNA repair